MALVSGRADTIPCCCHYTCHLCRGWLCATPGRGIVKRPSLQHFSCRSCFYGNRGRADNGSTFAILHLQAGICCSSVCSIHAWDQNLLEPFAQVVSAIAAGSKLQVTSNIMGTGVMGIRCSACSTRKESPWACCLNPAGESLSSYMENGGSDKVGHKNPLSEGSTRIPVAPLYLQT